MTCTLAPHAASEKRAHAALRRSSLRPLIDQINRIAQRPAQMPVGAADHPREPLAENRGRAVRIGIGQGRALHRPRAEMVQPRPMALQTREISRRLAAPASWP